jgi:hypothetical protein
MTSDPFDPQGEARGALSTAVTSYGMRVLSDPRILGNLVTDLLPDSPRERSLLVTAAEAGMATELSQHVEQQRLSVEAAVALVARGLTERRSIDIAASTWVATEYAHALGYQVRTGIPPSAQLEEDEAPLSATVRRPRPSSPQAPSPQAQSPQAQPPQAQPPQVPPQQAAGQQSPWSPPLPGQQAFQSPAMPPLPYPTPPGQQASSGQPAAYQPTAFSPPPARSTSQPSAAQPSGQPTSQPPSQPQAPYQASSYPPPSYQPPAQQPPSQPQSPYQAPSSSPQFPPATPFGMPASPYQPASGQPGSQPAGQQASPYQPAGFAAQPGYPTPMPGSPAQPAWGSVTPPRRSRRNLLLAIGGGVVVVGAIVGVIVAVSSPSPKKSPPVSHPTVTHTVTHTPSPTASATPTVASGVTPVVQLLPSDITDTTTECEPQSLPLPFKAPGLVTATKCADPGLTGSEVFAFQADSPTDYNTTWANYNKWLGFDPSSAGTACPPAGSQPQGITEWKPKSEAQYQRNQVLECGTLGSGSTSQVVYIWTFPSQDAFIVMQGAHSTTFSQLDTWWKAEA